MPPAAGKGVTPSRTHPEGGRASFAGGELFWVSINRSWGLVG